MATRTRPPRDRSLLHRIAAPMQPARLPYYVATPDQPGQLAGWYWIPPNGREPVALGSNAFMAHSALLTYLARNGLPDNAHDAA